MVKRRTAQVFIPDNNYVSAETLLLELPDDWTCITPTASLPAALFPTPPRFWYSLDSLKTESHPYGNWPVPLSYSTSGNLKLKILKVESENTNPSWLISGKQFTILLVHPSPTIFPENSLSRFHEKIDLLLIAGYNDKKVISGYRNTVRPRYTIAGCSSSDTTGNWPNLLLCPKSITKQFTFRDNRTGLKFIDQD